MKTTTSALALAGLVAMTTPAQADVEFGGDFEANAYTLDDGTSDHDAGIQQLTRVKAHFATEDGVQVNTRFVLTDNQWSGDTHEGDTNSPFSAQDADVVTLDYGYVQLPVAGWLLRVGRQEANWGFDFITSDDRRDRILAMKKFGSTTVFAVYDKRVEGTLGVDDDTDFPQLALVGVNNGWLWGAVVAKFLADVDGSALDGVSVFSPFIKGKLGPVTLTGAYGYVGGGEGALWPEDHHSMFLRAGYNFGTVLLEGQVGYVKDGGLVSGGWDSFSSLINNSPDANQNPLSVLRVGGVGGEGEVSLVAARVSGSVTEKFKLVGALGAVNQDITGVVDGSGSFAELQAHYQLADSTVTWLTLASGSFEDLTPVADYSAFSLNLLTNF